MRPSDILSPAPAATDFPSPLPFSKLGVEPPRLNVDCVVAFDRRSELDCRGVGSAARGLGGRLLARPGGWGKELMLTAFLSVFGPGVTGARRDWGNADAGAGDEGAVV